MLDAEVMVGAGRTGHCEYAVMMAVILVLVAATVRLIGSSATNTFAAAGSSITQ
jgi:Flp pilus assembly pilin Flp